MDNDTDDLSSEDEPPSKRSACLKRSPKYLHAAYLIYTPRDFVLNQGIATTRLNRRKEGLEPPDILF
jgi:hypothetical protein